MKIINKFTVKTKVFHITKRELSYFEATLDELINNFIKDNNLKQKDILNLSINTEYTISTRNQKFVGAIVTIVYKFI